MEKYLEAENAYTEATTADLKPFREALYAEMLGPDQADRPRRPHPHRPLLLLPPHGRGPAVPDPLPQAGGIGRGLHESAPEEVLLDQNEMAKGLAFLSVGEFEVSDDDGHLLYSTDDTGFRQYRLFVKELKSGAVQGPLAERVTSATWAADNRTRLLRDRAPGHETLGHAVAPQARRPAGEGLRGEGRALLDRGRPDQGQEVRRARQPVDRHVGPVAAPCGHAERRVPARPASREGPQVRRRAPRRHPLHPHEQGREELPSGDGAARRPLARRSWKPSRRAPVGRAARATSRSSGTSWCSRRSRRASTTCASTASPTEGGRRSPSPSPSTPPSPPARPEFESKLLRYDYQSLITPSSVYDYDMEAGTSTLLKREEVLGGFDPERYASERLWATARDGVEGADQHRLPEGPRPRRQGAAVALRLRLVRLRHVRDASTAGA